VIGKTISHYRVLAKIGEGAAGVVYKADDLSLGRGVALKFITPEQSWDATAMLRFQHEARMASSLNHPNICTVYEIGEHERSQFIAMELLEGDTLSHAIAGKPLALSNLLSIGIQICDALEAAHAENVIHRDLKPANVFVTTKNQVKILDFALAQFNPARAPVEPQNVKVWGTNAAGTVPYMSPEQINRTRSTRDPICFLWGSFCMRWRRGAAPSAEKRSPRFKTRSCAKRRPSRASSTSTSPTG
jgi:serine/threonine protein kinase